MQIDITFPGGSRVDAHMYGMTISTDQPVRAGGTGTAPAPYNLFLASLGTCAGYFVHAFCESRGLSTEGIRITQHVDKDKATGLAGQVRIEVQLPVGFPEKYHGAVRRAADQCSVKRSLQQPPTVETVIVPAGDAPAVLA